MNFVTLDFETATAQRDSPCEIGLTFVLDGKMGETKSWLIKPKYENFNYYNVLIHGIRPQDVAYEPEFDVLWKELRPLLENQFVIAHNAAFDMSVLRKTLEMYLLPFPNLQYACSYIFSKKIWKGLSAYDLKSLCNYNGIQFRHHRAGADSRATAEMVLKAFAEAEIYSLEDFSEKLNISVGRIFEGGYQPAVSRKAKSEKWRETGL